jgi:hypothetical protein
MRSIRCAVFFWIGLSIAQEGAIAQEKVRPAKKRTAADSAILERCLALTRTCQLEDGAIVQVAHGGGPDAPALVVPYFAQHVALAWVASSHHLKNKRDLQAAGRWLRWCASHQEPQGYWNHWDGTRRRYAKTAECDAWDSSASMYLVALESYERAGGAVSPEMIGAASKSLGCLESLMQSNGLTIAKPEYPVMYLMDNVESYAGAAAGSRLFNRLKRGPEQERAAAVALKVKRALPSFWKEEEKLFAWARHPGGAVDVGFSKVYPDGLAQLFGIAFVQSSGDLLKKTSGRFQPEPSAAAAAGSERWLMAAARVDADLASEWKAVALKDAEGFTPQVYSYRPALIVLAVLEGADWMPSLIAE